MNRVEITLEVKTIGQTNGKTYHVRSNCGNLTEKGGHHADSDTKLAETLLLLLAVIRLNQAKEAHHGNDS